MVKKIIKGISDGISVVIIIFAIIILLSVIFNKSGNKAPKLMGYSAFTVITGSMEPTIGVGSMVIVKEQDFADLTVGDVIAYYSSDPAIYGKVNTHRIYGIDEDESGAYIVTKGDANPIPDETVVRPEHIIGKVVFASSFLGKLIRLIANPVVFILLIIVPFVFIIGSNIAEASRKVKEIEQEELEEELKKRKEN